MHYTEVKIAKSICTLQRRFLQEIQFAGYVEVLYISLYMFAICFEYSGRPA